MLFMFFMFWGLVALYFAVSLRPGPPLSIFVQLPAPVSSELLQYSVTYWTSTRTDL